MPPRDVLRPELPRLLVGALDGRLVIMYLADIVGVQALSGVVGLQQTLFQEYRPRNRIKRLATMASIASSDNFKMDATKQSTARNVDEPAAHDGDLQLAGEPVHGGLVDVQKLCYAAMVGRGAALFESRIGRTAARNSAGDFGKFVCNHKGASKCRCAP